jgi:hypothetical protein
VAYHEAGHCLLGRKIVCIKLFAEPVNTQTSPRPEVFTGAAMPGPMSSEIDLLALENRHLADREVLITSAGNLAMSRKRGE